MVTTATTTTATTIETIKSNIVVVYCPVACYFATVSTTVAAAAAILARLLMCWCHCCFVDYTHPCIVLHAHEKHSMASSNGIDTLSLITEIMYSLWHIIEDAFNAFIMHPIEAV